MSELTEIEAATFSLFTMRSNVRNVRLFLTQDAGGGVIECQLSCPVSNTIRTVSK